MPTSTFAGGVELPVETTADGALSGDGSSGAPLAVNVDGVTVEVNGSNELQAVNGGNPFDQDLNTDDSPTFAGVTLTQTVAAATMFDVGMPVTAAGTGTVEAAGRTLTGTGTAFLTQLHIGDVVVADGQTRTITAIAANDEATLNFYADISALSSFTIQRMAVNAPADDWSVDALGQPLWRDAVTVSNTATASGDSPFLDAAGYTSGTIFKLQVEHEFNDFYNPDFVMQQAIFATLNRTSDDSYVAPFYGLNVEVQTANTNKDYDEITGMAFAALHTGSGVVGTLTGMQGVAQASGAGNVTALVGLNGFVENVGANTVASGQALQLRLGSGTGSTFTEAHLLKIDAPTGSEDNGTIGTLYGIRIADLSAYTTSTEYAIHSAWNAPSVLTGNLTASDFILANGGALRPDTTTAHTALLQAYDVNGTAYKTFGTLTNGDVPSFTVSQPSGGVLAIIPPTSDPGVSGAIWNNMGTLAIST